MVDATKVAELMAANASPDVLWDEGGLAMSADTVPYDNTKRLSGDKIEASQFSYDIEGGASVDVARATSEDGDYFIAMYNTQPTGERTELKFRMSTDAARALVDGIVRHHNKEHAKEQ